MSEYQKITLATAMTPDTPEHYATLVEQGVRTALVTVHMSEFAHYPAGAVHARVARKAGMQTCACMITDLKSPVVDARAFCTALKKGIFTSQKVAIVALPLCEQKDAQKRLEELIQYVSCYVDADDILVGLTKDCIDKHYFDIKRIKQDLMVICSGTLNAGIDRTSVWLYETKVDGEDTYLGYDYYGFFADTSYQLTLDEVYIAQPGDSWVTIATCQGIWLPKLLELNDAQYSQEVIPGQRIKIR